MKTLRITRLAALLALFAASGPIHAALVLIDDIQFGKRSVVLDEITGRAWLPLSKTAGQSFNEVFKTVNGNNTNWKRWRIATADQVGALFSHGGVDTSGIPDTANARAVQRVMSLLGGPLTTVEQDGLKITRIDGMVWDKPPGKSSAYLGGFLQVTQDGTDIEGVAQSGRFDLIPKNGTSPMIGTFLTFQAANPVPEPETWAMLGLGLTTLLLRTRRRK
ncbi:PEP-CTERM sorting domain-containing protein [Paludibacterium paludis]|uniref:Ice-binding protein C-terminal domain-containing protein n=1 Tax=Paludibacterium paludis TaxID=1225769 RepID=A0A918P726_9NEIS|nr:PEP-CTERM sorting domain-containing protein [Paludibacterium paludis]GGY25315.1 hypothetical protein GCM10011289_31120 [Paludibacterium paludis]